MKTDGGIRPGGRVGSYHACTRCPPASTMTARVTSEMAIFLTAPAAREGLRRPSGVLRTLTFGSARCCVRLSGSARRDEPDFDRLLRILVPDHER